MCTRLYQRPTELPPPAAGSRRNLTVGERAARPTDEGERCAAHGKTKSPLKIKKQSHKNTPICRTVRQLNHSHRLTGGIVMRRFSVICLIAVIAGGLSGCKWDDHKYDLYVGDDGIIHSCENVEYFEYIKEDGTSIKCTTNSTEDDCRQFMEPLNDKICLKGYECLTDNDNRYYCGVKIDTVQCKEDDDCKEIIPGWISGSCENGVCVADKCKSETHLYHNNEDGSVVCEINDKNNCGMHGVVCELIEHSNSVACQTSIESECDSEDECIKYCIYQCDDDYHFKDGQCVKDSDAECGNDLLNCTKIESFSTNCDSNSSCDTNNSDRFVGKCNNEMCVAVECGDNYHIFNNKCEPDIPDRCGMKNENNKYYDTISCVDKLKRSENKYDGIKTIGCRDHSDGKVYEEYEVLDDECAIVDCKKGYHFNRYKSRCIPDSVKQCGSFNQNCLNLEGINLYDGIENHLYEDNLSVQCTENNFDCEVKEGGCKEGYHLYVNDNYEDEEGNIRAVKQCEADTVEHCGTERTNCKEKFGDEYKCTKSQNDDKYDCSLGCGSYLSECNGLCVNYTNDPLNCGKCNNKCESDDNTMSVGCVNSDCVVNLCKNGYFKSSSKKECIKIDDNNCGKENRMCKRDNHQYCDPYLADCACENGYADCDGDPLNGCEIKLSDYHMSDCKTCRQNYCDSNGDLISNRLIDGCETTNLDYYGLKSGAYGYCECSEEYDKCGEVSGTTVPLCLAQGKYYKNYDIKEDPANNVYYEKEVSINMIKYYYDYFYY